MKFKLLLIAFCLITLASFSLSAKDAEVKIKANMHCASCVTKIENGLKTESGVSTTSADLKSKVVTIKYDDAKTNPESLKKAISGMGFDADVQSDKSCDSKEGKCCSTKDKKAKVKKS